VIDRRPCERGFALPTYVLWTSCQSGKGLSYPSSPTTSIMLQPCEFNTNRRAAESFPDGDTYLGVSATTGVFVVFAASKQNGSLV
jgi:hypothetical protein